MGDKTYIFSNTGELAPALATHMLEVAAESVAARQRFTIALSGGSAMKLLVEGLASVAPFPPVDSAFWHVFWADERCVLKTHHDSNFAAAHQAWLSETPIPRDQVHSIDDTLPPADAAHAYAVCLAEVFQPAPNAFPQFDLILLGVGEDGHTASLFPGDPALEESERWVVPVFNAPKPPSERITLTLPLINQARQIAVVATGAGKTAVMTRVRGMDASIPVLPIQRIRPQEGEIRWFLDSAAAGLPADQPIPFDLNPGAAP